MLRSLFLLANFSPYKMRNFERSFIVCWVKQKGTLSKKKHEKTCRCCASTQALNYCSTRFFSKRFCTKSVLLCNPAVVENKLFCIKTRAFVATILLLTTRVLSLQTILVFDYYYRPLNIKEVADDATRDRFVWVCYVIQTSFYFNISLP